MEYRTLNGERVALYPVSQLAHKLDVNRSTVVAWEDKGILPPPMFTSEGGHRRYTELEILFVEKLYQETLNGRKNLRPEMLPEFGKKLKEGLGKIRSNYATESEKENNEEVVTETPAGSDYQGDDRS